MKRRNMKNIEKNNEEKILDATLRVIESYTISGTRISLIAKEADMLQSNVLYYYKTKEEILVAMQKRILDIFPKLREELRDNTEDTLESALEVFSKNEENLLKNFPEYNHAEMDFWVQSRTDEDTRVRFAESYDLWRQEIREVLEKYVPDLPENLKKILPAQYVSMLEGFTIQYLIDENNMDMTEYFAMSRELILNTVKPYMK
ncbi:transcriptional regulator, TetR family [Butyrivibrio fibrisolvens DSM 3071]|uniref:Transcriptional regulator, TetR family n=2 Tax=Butyrivibrio fibrisolvens TaxID=831 RepID=A0A1M5YV22_BUTFI|nr:transcriptional regulator, TetR family [Butyrivibrio fibrisolvens DSM 3071]